MLISFSVEFDANEDIISIFFHQFNISVGVTRIIRGCDYLREIVDIFCGNKMLSIEQVCQKSF